jgi:hypothetical protein
MALLFIADVDVLFFAIVLARIIQFELYFVGFVVRSMEGMPDQRTLIIEGIT